MMVYGKLVSLKHLTWVSAQEDVSEDFVSVLIWCRERIN
jgi:hypothetical protein